jgi:predicted ATP-dependent serine protease
MKEYSIPITSYQNRPRDEIGRNIAPFISPVGTTNSVQNRYEDFQAPLETFSQLSLSPEPFHPTSRAPRIRNQSYSDCSKEQNQVLSLVAQGQNVFFTGSAGVGKSFVILKIKELLKSSGMVEFQDFFVTASTGSHFRYKLTV